MIFAHRSDHTGIEHETDVLDTLLSSSRIVPMEEVVRAFNFVVEKGWVSDYHSDCLPVI